MFTDAESLSDLRMARLMNAVGDPAVRMHVSGRAYEDNARRPEICMQTVWPKCVEEAGCVIIEWCARFYACLRRLVAGEGLMVNIDGVEVMCRVEVNDSCTDGSMEVRIDATQVGYEWMYLDIMVYGGWDEMVDEGVMVYEA